MQRFPGTQWPLYGPHFLQVPVIQLLVLELELVHVTISFLYTRVTRYCAIKRYHVKEVSLSLLDYIRSTSSRLELFRSHGNIEVQSIILLLLYTTNYHFAPKIQQLAGRTTMI
jgi:hypothetical protein